MQNGHSIALNIINIISVKLNVQRPVGVKKTFTISWLSINHVRRLWNFNPCVVIRMNLPQDVSGH